MAYGTYGMSSTPMISSTMPNPMGVTSVGMNRAISMSQPMTTTGLQAGTVRNMNLPLSRATPIQVTEITPNLEEIQNFPVAGRGLDGTHFHQDPVSGQMYVMTAEFHNRIPQILANRINMNSNVASAEQYNESVISYLENLMTEESKKENITTNILQEFNTTTVNSKDIMDSIVGVGKIELTNNRLMYQPGNFSISNTTNIPGVFTADERSSLQNRLNLQQTSTNINQFDRTSQFNEYNEPYNILTNMFDSREQITLSNNFVESRQNYQMYKSVEPTNEFPNLTATAFQQTGVIGSTQKFGGLINDFGTILSSPPVVSAPMQIGIPVNSYHR